MFHFGDDEGLAQRGALPHFADADWVSDNHGLLVFVWLRKEIQPALRQIDDNTLTQSRWQTVPPRQKYARALTGQPHVDHWIGPSDFFVAQSVAPGNIRQ